MSDVPVTCVNDALAGVESSSDTLSINVLDIYGFEVGAARCRVYSMCYRSMSVRMAMALMWVQLWWCMRCISLACVLVYVLSF